MLLSCREEQNLEVSEAMYQGSVLSLCSLLVSQADNFPDVWITFSASSVSFFTFSNVVRNAGDYLLFYYTVLDV